MPVISGRYEAPGIKLSAFTCPHCHALAKQFWYNTSIKRLDKDHVPPSFSAEEAETFGNDLDDKEMSKTFKAWAQRVAKGLPFSESKETSQYVADLENVSVSSCFNCEDITIWIGDGMVYPSNMGSAPEPNPDLNDDVVRDYREAAAILLQSPRGAAALLRLALQKLLVQLGQSGRDLNADIGALVRNGLDMRVQRALDVVRVIGNNAVHPGQIDLRDDRATAERLFGLLNLIVDTMVSQPRHVSQMYEALPTGALKAIENRDSD